MAVALPLILSGLIAQAGVTLPPAVSGAVSSAGVRLPLMVSGAATVPLRLPSMISGGISASVTLFPPVITGEIAGTTTKLPSLESGQSQSFGLTVQRAVISGIAGPTGKGALFAVRPVIAGGPADQEGHLIVSRPTVFGRSGSSGNGALAAQMQVIAATGYTGSYGVGSLKTSRPIISGEGFTGAHVLALKRAVISGLGYTGTTGYAKRVIAPRQEVSGIGHPGVIIRTSMEAPRAHISATGMTGSVGYGRLTASARTATGSGYAWATGAGRLVAKKATLSGTGYSVTVGAGRLTAQRAVIGSQNVIETGEWLSFIMNAANFAVTESTHQFDSYAMLGGKMLAANGDGVFELTGNTDDGVEIAANVKTGRYDLGTRKLKRATDVYGAYRAEKDMTFTVFNGEDGFEYRLPKQDGLLNHKANLGRGLRHTYHQYGLANRGGGDFTLDSIRLVVETLSR